MLTTPSSLIVTKKEGQLGPAQGHVCHLSPSCCADCPPGSDLHHLRLHPNLRDRLILPLHQLARKLGLVGIGLTRDDGLYSLRPMGNLHSVLNISCVLPFT